MSYINDKDLKDFFNEIRFVFKRITHIREHLDIIFVFGKATVDGRENTGTLNLLKNLFKNANSKNTTNSSKRTEFLNFIKNNNETQFQFITIEKLYMDIVNYSNKGRGVKSKKIHLAELELSAIKNAYSILIFPESPGSFAELGYFAAIKETREKIIVSNHLNYHDENSYVNSLIELIHEDKAIKPVLFDSNSASKFTNYLKNLNERFTDYEREIFIEDEVNKHYMYPISVIYELIKMFPYLEFTELKFLTNHAFSELNIKEDNIDDYLSSMISLLVVSNMVERKDEKYFIIINQSFSCCKFSDFNEPQQQKLLFIEMKIRELKNIK